MSSVAEIEEAITHLQGAEFLALSRWFDELRNRRWDAQMDEDAAAGTLDFLSAELDQHLARGEVRPLDEILRHS